jgi:hypothetical protein
VLGLGYGGAASAACLARNEPAVYHGRTSTVRVGTRRRPNESLNLVTVASAPPQIGTRLADK